MITLVDQEVLAFKRVYDVTKDQSMFAAPGMDAPQATFAFLEDVTTSAVNNGILSFTNVADARLHLKRQLAHIFGELLRVRFDPVRAELKDILSELKTLRHEFRPAGTMPDQPFLRGIRFLVDDSKEARVYRLLLSMLRYPVDSAVPQMLKAENFDDFVRAISGHDVHEIRDDGDSLPEVRKRASELGVAR